MRAALAAMSLAACVTPPKPPPLKDFALGMSRASYRDYRGAEVGICDSEPRWLLDELASVNSMLDRFLEATATPPGEEWTDEQLKMLEEAAKSLPEVLEVHEANLKRLGRCDFADSHAFPTLRERGLAYVSEARARVAQAPDLIAYVRAKDALERWKDERPRLQLAAKEGCPSRPRVGDADLYFAYEDEQGQTIWLFCDGAIARASRGGAPELFPPANLGAYQRRRFKSRPYLEAVRSFPKTAIHRPPDVPEPPSLNARRP